MKLYACLLTILALFTTVASAQTSTAAISGVVSDSSGAVIPGARVTAINEATGVSLSQLTTGNGVYSFPGLPVGTYTVSVEMTGFKITKQSGNVLDVESPLTINLTLQLGNAAETVTVVASNETLQTSNAEMGNVISQKEIVELPLNGRNPLGLLALEPGVVQASSSATGTGFHVNGSRDMAHNNTIDGIDANESAVNSPMNNLYRLNPDAIQEYKVVTSNPTAEIGRNSGANTSIATRSGTNLFHGTAYEFLRNTDLDSNEFFANANGTPKPDLKMNQFGANIGGPIRKNKTFFFASWQDTVTNYSEPISQAYGTTPTVYTPTALAGNYRYWVADPKQPFVFLGQTITKNNTVLVDPHTGALRSGIRTCASNTDANCVASFNMYSNDPSHIGADPTIAKLMSTMPAPNLYSVGDGLNTAGYQWNSPIRDRGQGMLYRIDHVINDNENLFARYLHGTDNVNSDPGGDARPQLYPNTPPLGQVYRGSDNGAIGLHSVLSAHIFNELTAGVSRFSATFTQGQANPAFPNVPAYCRGLGSAFNNIDAPCRNVPETAREITTPQVLDNLTIVRGSHIIKTGLNFRFYQHNDQRGEPNTAIAVTPTISFSASVRPPSGFNVPATATTSVAGIAAADSTRLLGTINDLMGIPASLSQSFLANLATNTYLPFSNGGNSVNLFTLQNRLKQYDSFVQDEWKISPTFTLTAGVRWEANPAPTEANGPAYVPNQPITGGTGLVSFVPESRWLKRNNLDAFAPRFSLAWNPLPKTVIRTGYGMAFDTLSSFQVTAAAGNVPGLTTTCVARPTVTPVAGCPSVPNLRIGQGFPEQLPPPTLQPSTYLTPAVQLYTSAPNALTLDPYLKVPTVHMWNFTIQRELGKGFILDAGYVGKRGTRLYRAYDLNQISGLPILPSFLLMQQNVNAGCHPDGTGCPSGVKGQSIPLVTSGIETSTFVNSTTTINNLANNDAGGLAERIEANTLAAKLRPNQQFDTITYMDSGGDSYYHSLQTVLQKRFDSGLLLRAAYTFGKSIDDQSVDPVAASTGGGLSSSTSRAPADGTNWNNERGLSDFDRTHVLTTSWVYQLPFGNHRRFFASMPRFLDTIAGGWSLKGIVTGMSGEPFSVRSGYFTNNYSHTSRAEIIGPKPAVTLTNAPGVIGPVYFFGETGSFAIPPPGSDGAGRNIFRATPYWNADLSVSKEFRLNERVRLELRAESFNSLNHPNFENPRDATSGSSAFTSTSFGKTCCDTMTPPSTGAIISTGEAARVIQFGLKLQY
jgi:hypothetical protein